MECFTHRGTEQLMVAICGFWAVPHPGWEDSFKPHKLFWRSAHTRVAWLTKMQSYSNVKTVSEAHFFWSSPYLHSNECKSLIFSGAKCMSHFQLLFAGNYKAKWRNSMLCIKYFETVVFVIPLLLWGKSLSHYPKILQYEESCRDLLVLILAYCFSFLKHAEITFFLPLLSTPISFSKLQSSGIAFLVSLAYFRCTVRLWIVLLVHFCK